MNIWKNNIWILFLFIFICLISSVLIINGLVQKETSLQGTNAIISIFSGNSTGQEERSGVINDEEFIAERITKEISLQRKKPPAQMSRRVVVTPERIDSLTPEEKKIISNSSTRPGVFLNEKL